MRMIRARQPSPFVSLLLTLLMVPGSAPAAWMRSAAPHAAPELAVAQAAPPPPTSKAPAQKPSTAKPTATAATATATAPDGGWPRAYDSPDGARIVVYEPQISDWEDQKKLTLHAAVSYTPKGDKTTHLGTLLAQSNTRVSVEERLVDFSAFQITQANFPTLAKENVGATVATIRAAIPEQERVIGLDRVLAFVDASDIRPKNVEGVKADPPTVFYSTRAAILVNIDGEPVWSPIANNDLKYAVNTNWDLFEHSPTTTFYLRHGKIWLKAAAVKGPWTTVATLPESFRKLPADENWNEVRAALPTSAKPPAGPTVFVSTQPAELILLTGEPVYRQVTGTGLVWVSNTEADVFRQGPAGTIYYLVAGRWFSAPAFAGPWTFATLTLPADFKKIPLEHERSRVLASVPGTTQAAEAVLLAQVPQTARVNKKELKAPDVAYQGEPTFEKIETTSVTRATNTDKDIFKVGDLYYMCYEGVWFVGRASNGPWEVASSVPQEIYSIPVSSAAHHVTYVTIEDDDDDEWVTFATAAAYTGVMVAWGCAVWGTGYYYPPYVWYGGYYPAYFPRYPTYGYSAWYNPWTGTYGRGMAAYGPYGGAGIGARYNPRTGTYARGAAAYGPYGSRGVAEAYNPRTGAYAQTRQGSNVYGSWGSTAVQRGDDWAATARTTNRATGTTSRVTRTDDGGAAASRRGPQGSGFVGQTGGGDVYAGRDGNVYRKQGESWQKYDNGSWGNVPQATPQQRDQAAARAQDRAATSTTRSEPATMSQLDRDASARRDGATRSSAASTARSTSSSGGRSTGSYRPSGGGARGGGGGRRR